MSPFPTAQRLAQTAAALDEIEPETRAQSLALNDAKRLLNALAQAPEVVNVLSERLASACEVLGQSARERTIGVIASRLRAANNQVMDCFDQGRSNPALRSAYLTFAKATCAALKVAPVNPLDDDKAREAQSLRRAQAFDDAEATVAAVRQGLKQRMGRLPSGSGLRSVANDYLDSGSSNTAFIEHLELAIAVLEAPEMATSNTKRRSPGR